MLGCLEADIEISDTGIETLRSNDCREISGNNGNANGILTVMQENVRFSYKNE